MEGKVSSMEGKAPGAATIALTAVPPVVWGSTYAVSQLWLPPDRPLFAATARVLPAGLLLLLWVRRLPRGRWWGRSVVLGGLNHGLFFGLLYLAAFRNHGSFHEACTLDIARRVVEAIDPVWARIGGYWYPRGGIPIDVFWQTGAPLEGLWLPDQGVPPYRGRG